MATVQARAEDASPVGYGELVRQNDNFRNLWFGQIISLLGDWFNLIASAALIGQLTESGLAVGSLFVVRMLAPFLISPIAGVVADRYNRKWILLTTDLVRAVVVFGFLFVRQADDLWLLYTLTAIQLGISGFFFPARNAILPDIVSPRELGAANALSSATWSVMLALGAALGGLVSGAWGIRPAFVIDGITFFASAWFIWHIRLAPRTELSAAEKTLGAALRQYVDGLRYLGQHVDVLLITLHKAVNSLILSSGFQVIQVAIAQHVFTYGEGGGISLGLMFALAGVGTGIGPIVARYFSGDDNKRLRWFIALGYIIGGLGLLFTAPLPNFATVLIGTALRGIGGGIIWVFSTQLLMQLVPGHVRGRVFATEFAFFNLASAAAAAVIGGALDSSLGLSTIIWWMAAFSIVPTVLWTAWLVGGQRDVPEQAAHVAD
ncbi:MAG: MFS transporter [Caldilineaceae bacterium]|nr:MFS transporter [Caldilineaceae bacterium]